MGWKLWDLVKKLKNYLRCMKKLINKLIQLRNAGARNVMTKGGSGKKVNSGSVRNVEQKSIENKIQG